MDVNNSFKNNIDYLKKLCSEDFKVSHNAAQNTSIKKCMTKLLDYTSQNELNSDEVNQVINNLKQIYYIKNSRNRVNQKLFKITHFFKSIFSNSKITNINDIEEFKNILCQRSFDGEDFILTKLNSAKGDLLTLNGLGSGSYCVSETGKVEYPYKLNVKISGQQEGKTISKILELPVKVSDNGKLEVEFKHYSNEDLEFSQSFNSFLDLEKYFIDLTSDQISNFFDDRGGPSIIYNRISSFKPHNESQIYNDEKVEFIFNETIKNRKRSYGMYKLSRKMYPLNQSKYVLYTKSGVQIFDAIHGGEGYKGSGAFTRYKKLKAQDGGNDLVVGKQNQNLSDEKNVENLTKVEKKLYSKFRQKNTPISKCNIVSIKRGYKGDKVKVYVATEKTGSVDRLLENNEFSNLSSLEKLLLIRDLARTLQEIHREGFAHRDYKLANVLYDSDDLHNTDPSSDQFRVQIGDCGGVQDINTAQYDADMDLRYLPFQNIILRTQLASYVDSLSKSDKLIFGQQMDIYALLTSISQLYLGNQVINKNINTVKRNIDVENDKIKTFMEWIIDLKVALQPTDYKGSETFGKEYHILCKENIPSIDLIIEKIEFLIEQENQI